MLATLVRGGAEGGETGTKAGGGITGYRSAARGGDRCWGGRFSGLSEGGGCASTLTVIEVQRLLPAFDDRDVPGIVHGYAAELPLKTSSDLNELVFAARLIHASDREFGNVIKYVLRAIRLALINEAAELSRDHFAQAYQQKTNCPAVSNPFVEDDFERIDVRAWLRTDEEDDR